MKNKNFVSISFAQHMHLLMTMPPLVHRKKTFFAIVFIIFSVFCVRDAVAQSFAVRLPYVNKENFIVTQGYNSLPTHVNKDSYALDFSQNGCSAYGKDILAAASGRAWIVEEAGYNGGYGTEILILDDDNVVSRYAHFVQGSISVNEGDKVKAGAILGKLGNTGLVRGATCTEHPGTHLHFAMYNKNADGSFSAQNPEPISGYSNIAEGRWYLSDNSSGVPNIGLLSNIGAIMANAVGSLFNMGGGSYIEMANSTSTSLSTGTSTPLNTNTSTLSGISALTNNAGSTSSIPGTASGMALTTHPDSSKKNSGGRIQITMDISSSSGAVSDENIFSNSGLSSSSSIDIASTESSSTAQNSSSSFSRNQFISVNSQSSQDSFGSAQGNSSEQVGRAVQNIPPMGGVSISLPAPMPVVIVVLAEDLLTNESTSTASSSSLVLNENVASSAVATVESSSTINIENGGNSSTSLAISSSTSSTQDDSIPSVASSSTLPITSTSTLPVTGGIDNTASTTVSSSSGISTSTATSSVAAFSLAAPAPVAGTNAIGTFNSSTLAIDFAWIAPKDASGSSDGIVYSIFDLDATSTSPTDVLQATSSAANANSSGKLLLWTGTSTTFSYPVSFGGTDRHFGISVADIAGDRAYATTTVSVPNLFVTIQPVDSSYSHSSWYSDNWYQLGTGFNVTIRNLILEASENYGNCYQETNSYLNLLKFSDPNYTNLIASTPIFSGLLSTITSTSTNKTLVSGLSITLDPISYYRLDTSYYCQNGSVILKGTIATGTAMWNMFAYGAGRVPFTYSFYPYLSWILAP